MAHLREQGRFTGGKAAPYGYEVGADDDLHEVPEEQAPIERARALRALGLSLREVAAQLEGGAGPSGGARFQPQQVSRMTASS